MKTSLFGFIAGCSLVFVFSQPVLAAKENFNRSKPHLNIGTIGHVDHGKTTLTAALALTFGSPVYSRVLPCEEVDGARPTLLDLLTTKIHSGHRQYRIHDFDAEGTSKNLITGAVPLEAAILVVSATEGITPQTREHVLLARQVGVPGMVVFLNDAYQVRDSELLDLVELEIRELLSFYDYDGDNTPIIAGSALRALEGDPIAQEELIGLVESMDRVVRKKPGRRTSGPGES